MVVLSGERYTALHSCDVPSGPTAVRTSLFLMLVRSSPCTFSTMRSVSSSKAMSSLWKGVSFR